MKRHIVIALLLLLSVSLYADVVKIVGVQTVVRSLLDWIGITINRETITHWAERLLIFLTFLAFAMFGTSLSGAGRDIFESISGKNATFACGLIAFGLLFVTVTLFSPKWLRLLSGVVAIVVGIVLEFRSTGESVSRSLPAHG